MPQQMAVVDLDLTWTPPWTRMTRRGLQLAQWLAVSVQTGYNLRHPGRGEACISNPATRLKALTFNFSTPGELGSVLNLSCTLKLLKENSSTVMLHGRATPESKHFQSMQPRRRDQTFLRARSQGAIPNLTLVNASPLETNQWSSAS